MKLTDEIRNYEVTSALTPEKIKTSREYYALAVLKYAFPDMFANLRKLESPDLQDLNSRIGIEVTWSGSPIDEQISGEYQKYLNSTVEEYKEKRLEIIKRLGGDIDEFSVGFPVTTSEQDAKNLENIFTKKCKKADTYKKHIEKVGLAVIMDIPLFFFTIKDWGKWLSGFNKGSFNFMIMIHWSGVDIYSFEDKSYKSVRINREDMDALKKIGRMTAEGLIKEDDTVWVDCE